MNETHSPSDTFTAGHGPEPGQYDWSATTPSVAVVDAVAERTGRDPSTLDPLYEAVETDALNRLLAREADTARPVSVAFTYGGCDVVVRGDGTVAVEPTP